MGTNVDNRSRRLYRFGPFRVDPERELLLRDEQTVALAPKAFQVLLVLIRSEKRLVTKDELLKSVWPDTFVEETNLSRNVFLLRKALGESPQDRQYILTVPGRGYRFAEDVEFVADEELEVAASTRSTVEIEIKETMPWGWIALGVSALVFAALLSWKFLRPRTQVPTAAGLLVLADFANSTGDPVFDGTLRQGLAIQLAQSPFVKVVDDAVLERDLRLMDQPVGAAITPPLAHDICVREGGAASIEGSIAKLGRNYAITLVANDCRERRTLAREQIQAEDKEHILQALGTAAAELRNRLGESLGSIQQRNLPLEKATTSSLEALKDYSTGLTIAGQGRAFAAIPLFERAIAIDPRFTMAYFLLGVSYEQAGEMKRSAEYARQAFSMVDRVSEGERNEITAYYYRATGDLNKQVDAFQLTVRDDPRYWANHNQLSLIYIDMGRFEEGLREAQIATQLQPDVEAPYRRLLDALMCLDRLEEAERTAARAREMKIDGPRIHQRFVELAYLKNDPDAISRELAWFAGRPEAYLGQGLDSAVLNAHGQRRAAHEKYEKAAQSARKLGLEQVAAELEEADAQAAALSGDCSVVHRLGRPALALAMCGEIALAEKLAAEQARSLPEGTILNAVELPEIQAMVAIERNHPQAALETLASALPFERAYPDATYVRGLAFLQMNQGTAAVTEFRKLVDHPGANWAATWIHPNWGQYSSMAYLGMARGLAMAGQQPQARQTFEKLFARWKDGDSDVRVLSQAKAEYARLR